MVFNPHDFMKILKKRYKTASIIMASFIIAGFLLALFLPKRYVSTGIFYIVRNDSGFESPLQGMNILSSLSSMNQNQVEVYNLITTRFVKDNAADKTGLMEKIDAKKRYMAYQWLDEHISLNYFKDGTIVLACYDTDKEFAAEMVNTYLSIIDSFYTQSDIFIARNYRKYMEERVKDLGVKMEASAESLAAFQLKTGLLQPDKEAESFYSFIITPLIQDIVSKKLEIEKSRIIEGNTLKSSILQQDYNLTVDEFEKLTNTQSKFMKSPLSKMPENMKKFFFLKTNLEVASQLYAQSKLELENAYMNELKNVPSIHIIDRGIPAERYTFPRKRDGLLFGLIMGMLTTVIWILFVARKQDEASA